MKTALRSSLLIFAALSIVLPAFAQDNRSSKADKKEQRQWEREQRKTVKEQLREEAFKVTRVMVDSQRFVLEASHLSNRSGTRASVNPAINFIMVDSGSVILQLGSDFAIGPNGVGGETLEGKMIRYEVKRAGRDKNNYNIEMTVLTAVGMYDIFLTVNAEGNAVARLRSQWSTEINYHGRLVPLEASRIYKGQTLY